MRIFRTAWLGLAWIAASTTAQVGSSVPAYIFFDWGKGELSSDATAILDGVIEAYRQAPRPVLLDGHSDRSGPAGSNIASSRRRAFAARDYLVAHGVPADVITVRAYGESAPIIATEDGVREIQNRRVEIRFAAPAN
jgi:outer membrane protein OmpA-like peptidoglycan-associated protein